MTIAEFNKTGFRKGMYIEYKGEKYLVSSVNFEEKLIGFISCGEESWARCGNCKLIKL